MQIRSTRTHHLSKLCHEISCGEYTPSEDMETDHIPTRCAFAFNLDITSAEHLLAI